MWRVVAVRLRMREDFDWNWLRCWTHPVWYIHMRILLDVSNVLPSFLLFLVEWHYWYRNFALSCASLQLCKVIILLGLDLARLRPDALLMRFVLDLHVEVLLELNSWLRELKSASSCAIFLCHGSLRAKEWIEQLVVRSIISIDCLGFQKTFELLMLTRCEIFFLSAITLSCQVTSRRPAKAARLADLALLLQHVTPVLVEVVVNPWSVQVLGPIHGWALQH